MIAELGHIALILALLLAVLLATLPLLGAQLELVPLIRSARPLAHGQLGFLTLAYAALTAAFLDQDFSVAYVAQNSNLDLPWYYRLSAVWGAHEGSLLLWVLILALWTSAVAWASRDLPPRFVARVLAVLGMVAVGFLSFTVLTSNPFLRLLPAPLDGNDLNPLLQDLGLILHPPMLYMGYVGFSVAFAFAIAALLDGRLDQQWVRWSRPWTNVAWACLTAGIALGSWWAYYELGWGGWWFWDPVENASFMPWLVGAALIHSQAVTEKRGTFRSWTLLLAIAAFSLSLLGTFLVRSGVLTSVHAFASDPARGTYILVFLSLVIGGSLLLYALRAPKLAGGPALAWLSRESLLLANNVLLVSACAMVLIGTLYPLLADALGWGRISVGPPYFSLLFSVFTAPLVLLLPFGAFTRWQGDRLERLWPILRLAAGAAALAGALVWLILRELPVVAVLGLVLAFWVLFGTLSFVLRRWRQRSPDRPFLSAEMLGMSLAHLGVAFWLGGVMLANHLNVERDVRMQPGDRAEVAGYTFHFVRLDHHEGPNYVSDRALFEVYRDQQAVATLRPEKRLYRRGQVMTEAAIDVHLTHDLFVALGEPLGDSGAWAVRLYFKPALRWVWFGAVLMLVGGLIAATDGRLRRPVVAESRPTDLAPATA